VVPLVLMLACTRSAANHEDLGDRAYATGSYADALAEYQLGRKANAGSAALLAKVGAAAMHYEDYELAADAYRTLAKRDRSRADEAADGLDRVARAALTANDRTALASALTGLREVAPRRPLGRYVVLAALDAVDRGDTAEARALLPVAAASALDASRADSLLFVYGMTLVRVRDCSTAVRVFEGVVRRQRRPWSSRRGKASGCARWSRAKSRSSRAIQTPPKDGSGGRRPQGRRRTSCGARFSVSATCASRRATWRVRWRVISRRSPAARPETRSRSARRKSSTG